MAELSALDLVLVSDVVVEVMRDTLLKLVPDLYETPHCQDGLKSLRQLKITLVHQLGYIVVHFFKAVDLVKVTKRTVLVTDWGKVESLVDVVHDIFEQQFDDSV